MAAPLFVALRGDSSCPSRMLAVILASLWSIIVRAVEDVVGVERAQPRLRLLASFHNPLLRTVPWPRQHQHHLCLSQPQWTTQCHCTTSRPNTGIDLSRPLRRCSCSYWIVNAQELEVFKDGAKCDQTGAEREGGRARQEYGRGGEGKSISVEVGAA